MPCAICHTRKEKRFCLALHERICAPCCGREREVSLECPSECPHLQEARKHERPRKAEEMAVLFPAVDVPERFVYEREPLLTGLSFGIAQCGREERSLHDQEVLETLSRFARQAQIQAESGLYVAERAMNPSQQKLTEKLQQMLAQYREMEAKHLGASTLRDAETLQAIVFLARLAQARSSGRPRSRAFLDFLWAQFPATPEGVASGGSILLTG